MYVSYFVKYRARKYHGVFTAFRPDFVRQEVYKYCIGDVINFHLENVMKN